MDICETTDFCRPALKGHLIVIHSPVKTDFCSVSLFFPTELSEFVALITHLIDRANFQSKNDTLVTLSVVKAKILNNQEKNILLNKIHLSSVSKSAQKLNLQVKIL